MNRYCLLIALAFVTAAPLSAGKYNRVLDVGDPAPAWVDLPGVDEKKHALKDLSDKRVVVVVFTCNSCPYAVDVEDRLIALQRKYAGRGVALVAINVNKAEQDLPQAMKEKAETKGFRFPYLYDETQQIARDYGAIYTPEFYVLNQQRQVVYMGSMDDSPDGKAVTQRYVELAIDAALADRQPEVRETVPIGCRVRYERARRSRSKP